MCLCTWSQQGLEKSAAFFFFKKRSLFGSWHLDLVMEKVKIVLQPPHTLLSHKKNISSFPQWACQWVRGAMYLSKCRMCPQ